MLDDVVHGRIGLVLRKIYTDLPVSEIPGRIWAFLVELEREAALAEKAPRV
jgi:hypothetical protein